MILICFRHGLRASEVCELQWSDVEFETGTLHLRRAKGGATGTHPLLGDELRALRALKREAKSPFIFVSERGAPFTVSGLRLGDVLEWWDKSERRKRLKEVLKARDGVDPDSVIMSPPVAKSRGLTSTVTFPVGNIAPNGSVVKSTSIDKSVRLGSSWK